MTKNATFWLTLTFMFGLMALGFGWLAMSSGLAAKRLQKIVDGLTDGGYHRRLKDNQMIAFDRVVLEGTCEIHKGSMWASALGVLGSALSAAAAWWSA